MIVERAMWSESNVKTKCLLSTKTPRDSALSPPVVITVTINLSISDDPLYSISVRTR